MNNTQHIITYERAQSLIFHLKETSQWLYQVSAVDKDIFLKHLSPDATRIIESYLSEHHLTITDKQTMQDILLRVIADLEHVEKLTIVSAVDLTTTFLSKLHAWFCKNVDANIVIENRVDRKILGGIVVGWRGTQIDLSLNKMNHLPPPMAGYSSLTKEESFHVHDNDNSPPQLRRGAGVVVHD